MLELLLNHMVQLFFVLHVIVPLLKSTDGIFFVFSRLLNLKWHFVQIIRYKAEVIPRFYKLGQPFGLYRLLYTITPIFVLHL